MASTTNSYWGIVDVGEGDGAALQGGDGGTLHIVGGVADHEVKSHTKTGQDNEGPYWSSLIP